MRYTFRDPDLQDRFDREGFVVFPMLDTEELDALRKAFDELGPAPDDPQVACHSSFHSGDRGYKVAVDGVVRSTLDPHLEGYLDNQRVLPCNFITKWPGAKSGFGLHQDLALVDERFHRSAEVWVALDDIDELNGQLWMVPGSHRWLPTLRGISSFPFAFRTVANRVIRRHAVPVPTRRGDCVVFNHATLHFSYPNRSTERRLVAITDVIPREAPHIHYFGNGSGGVDAYAVGDSFWTDNSPFTLHRPPPDSDRIGPVHFNYIEMTDDLLDTLLVRGLAISSEHSPKGALNAAKPWCHRCGLTQMGLPVPSRTIGNVTLLCASCNQVESRRESATV